MRLKYHGIVNSWRKEQEGDEKGSLSSIPE